LKTFSWRELLQLQLHRNLRTYATAGYQRTEVPGTTTDSYNAEAGIEHQLYESLRSHLDVHARRTDFDGLREDLVGATGRLDYRKQTGLGYLTAGYSRTLDYFERRGGDGIRQVLNETITLQSNQDQFLANPNVIRESIQVTDAQGVPYTENFDYEIVESGNRTGIRLLPGGSLSPGDLVFVDYRFEFTSDIDYVADDQVFRIRHDFQKWVKGLALYYRWHDLTNHGVPERAEGTLLEFEEHVAGLNYRYKQVEWTEEATKYRSNFSDYDRLLTQFGGNHPLGKGLRWGWTAGLTLTDYKEEIPGADEDSEFWFATTRFTGPLTKRGYWSVEGRAQKETGRTDRTVLGVLGKIGLRWRQVRVESGARFEHYDTFDNERDRSHVFVQVARMF
jgi:hypothetical protein